MKVKKQKQGSIHKTRTRPNINPFEVHINRSKHQVLGRKLKSDKGMPGISKHKAFKKRKDTLLQEYKMRHKTNHFIDQRIGERNLEMTEDDRIMARFTAERMRMFSKKTMFNLSDSEILTHRGQTLSEIEKFENTRSDDEDDDEGRSGVLKGKFVGDAHFGGGMLTKNKQDRESLIDELINESKKRKAERQRNKEETLEATEKLDEEWKTLGQITTSAGGDSVDETANKTKEDGYDIVMRQLKFEPQGQASQRIKTDQEVAKEDKEKLEKLEHERLKQLREIEAIKFGNHRSSDDIDDGFSNLTNDFPADDEDIEGKSESSPESDVEFDNVDEEVETGINSSRLVEKTVKGIINKGDNICSKNNTGTTNSNEQAESQLENTSKVNYEKDLSSDESNNESSGEEDAMEDLDDLMPSLNESQSDNKLTNISGGIKSMSKSLKVGEESLTDSALLVSVDLDLPYILDVPESFESFKDLLHKHSPEQQHLIFERLLKSNHPTLDPANKKKILKLADYIIQFVNEEEIHLNALPNLILHFSIFKEFNNEECLKMLVESLTKKVDDFDDKNPDQCSMKFLIWYVMLFLKPHGMDVLLPINKPALSILSKVICQTDINSISQVKLSLLCCYLLLQDAISSSTVYTDAIIFLQNCLENYISKDSNTFDKSKNKRDPLATNKTLGEIKDESSLLEELKLHLTTEEKGEKNNGYKVFNLSAILLANFVKTYRKYPQSKIMFKKVHGIISKVNADLGSYPLSVKESIEELKTLLEILQTASFPSMVKAAKKPKALRQYEPAFHIITEGKRSLKSLPAEKQEEQKLLHKYKNEMKGAMRELRRDRVFLANVKLSEKAQSDAERIKKVKEIFGAASAQQGELRSLKRKK